MSGGIASGPIAGAPITGGSSAPTAIVYEEDLGDSAAAAEAAADEILPALRAGLTASDATAADVLATLRERGTAASSFDCAGRFAGDLSAGGTFTDAVAAAWGMLLGDAVTAADDAAGVARRLTEIADVLHALGHAETRLSAMAAVAVAATLEGKVTNGWSAEAADEGELVDAAYSTLRAMQELADAAVGVAAAEGAVRLTVLAADAAEIGDDPAAALRAMADLGDNAVMFCTLRLNGMDYQGWALNTDLRAVTEYRNVPFDSFAMLDGVTYAASEDGIYQLGGDTDDGAPIDAWIRPFLVDFGTHKMKQVTDIWIGTGSTGLAAKVRMKDPKTGTTYDVVYPVQYNHGTGTDKGRVEVGRGLVSQWWGLTISNVGGADFDIETIEWRALVLDRRQ